MIAVSVATVEMAIPEDIQDSSDEPGTLEA